MQTAGLQFSPGSLAVKSLPKKKLLSWVFRQGYHFGTTLQKKVPSPILIWPELIHAVSYNVIGQIIDSASRKEILEICRKTSLLIPSTKPPPRDSGVVTLVIMPAGGIGASLTTMTLLRRVSNDHDPSFCLYIQAGSALGAHTVGKDRGACKGTMNTRGPITFLRHGGVLNNKGVKKKEQQHCEAW